MRQTQYRVWDGCKLHLLNASDKEANHYLQFGEDCFWLFNAEGKMVTNSIDGGICEQFTGFTDKACRFICEGDILSDQVTTDEGVIDSHKQVYWDKEQGCWKLDDTFAQDKSYGTLLATELLMFEYKVVGNIHQNKDLLTGR